MSDNMEKKQPAEASEENGMRLARFLAKAGIGSRRSCEEYIREGRVTVNGEAVIAVGTCVTPGEDTVCFEGKPVAFEDGNRVYLMLNKPAGYTCSAKDSHAENLVYQLIPERFGRVFTVGRLDRDSEGLLILTNDGDFAQRLTHPSHEIYKRYFVECEGRFTTAIRRQLLDGMYDNGEFLHALNVEQISVRYGACSLIFTLGEGRKREVRRLCKDVGLRVKLLRRVSIGQLELDEKLTVGSWRIMSPHDCELALKPIKIVERPRPAEPPKPYWVKEKLERKLSRSPRGGNRDDDGLRGPEGRGKREDSRRSRRSASPVPARPQHPWYEEDDVPAPAHEEPRSPRGRYRGDNISRGGYRDDFPRDGYDEIPRRGGYRDDFPRDGYDEVPRRGGYARTDRRNNFHSPRNSDREGVSRGTNRGTTARAGGRKQAPGTRGSREDGFRRNKPPRSWR